MRKKEILPFATTWKELKGIMLSKISQRKTNSTQYHLYAESLKNQNSHKQRVAWWLLGIGGWGNRRKGV